MVDIVLSTLNARFSHTSFGLRYLRANLGDLRPRSEILEFVIQSQPRQIVEEILERSPRIVGFGVYIWNVYELTEVVSILKRVAPEIVVVIGGPEVSYETEDQEIVQNADFVITGEADNTFRELCSRILTGEECATKIIRSPVPKADEIALPYQEYTDEDIARRTIYVEASRGCPFTCEFCLSSLDIPVRQFDTELFLAQLELLYQRGARSFKFVDRTFNLNLRTTEAIIGFFRERLSPDLFVHFEMVPDRLPPSLISQLAEFPPGAIQLEIGIQTFNSEVSQRISRRQNYPAVTANLRRLRSETGAHLHVDLIVGLPGESLESIADGFNTLVSLNPHEIQVGILKRLRGTPLVRHEKEFLLVFNTEAPYELLSSRDLNFFTMQRLSRFARFWDLYANSGRFPSALSMLWKEATPFEGFIHFADWIYAQAKEHHGISVKRLAEFLFKYLTTERGLSEEVMGPLITTDYTRNGAHDVPQVLKRFVVTRKNLLDTPVVDRELPKRQMLHHRAQD